MGIIKTMQLMHDFIVKDEEGKIESVFKVLKGVDLEIEKGSFVALLGHNGSGKSTLARHLNGLLKPTNGTVWVNGYSTEDEAHLPEIRRSAGMVFQNPDNQIIASIVEEDVAFGPENIGVPSEEIWERVADSLEKSGMTAYRYHSPNKLSGGQKQRIAIAGILAMQPDCMILDEATAMLDPIGRVEVLAAVHALNKMLGVTVIMITHYMEEAAEADRVIVMNEGSIVMDGCPKDIFSRVDELEKYHLTVPASADLAYRLRADGMALPEGIIRSEELKAGIIEALKKPSPAGEKKEASGACPCGDEGYQMDDGSKRADILSFENVNYIYSPGTSFSKQALKNINLTIKEGSFTGLIGHTGSGKSTLIQHMDALMRPTEGHVYFRGQDISAKDYNRKTLCQKVGLVFQYPEYQLFDVTVLKDVAFGPKNTGLSEAEALERAREALKMTGIAESDFEKSPFELSGGQKRRVAIAGVIAMKPDVLVLDEPAAGLDPAGKTEILDLIYRIHLETGMTVVLSSHSMEDMAKYADRLIVMNQGQIVRDGTPYEVYEDYEYLESIGLRAPEMVYLMSELKAEGYAVDTKVLTAQDAERAIIKLWRAGV